MPYAVDMMAHYAFAVLPVHLIKAKGLSWTKPGIMVSNGPFILKEWKPNERIVVERNPKYWDTASVSLQSITFLPISNMLTAYNRYKAGELDWSTGIPLELIDEVKRHKDYQVAPQIGTYYYIFNITRKPLDDVRVRKALSLALDKQVLIDTVIRGGQLPTDALTPSMAGYEPPKGASYNPTEARRLLAEAGFPGGKGFPDIELIYNTSAAHKKIIEWVLESWQKVLGITTIRARNIEWSLFLDTRQSSHDFYIARAGWIGDYLDPNTFLDMFLSNSGLNDGLYTNPAYDALVQKGNSLPAGLSRFDTLRQAEEMLISRDQAVLPLYYYVNQDIIDVSRWDGWFPNPLGAHEWKYIRPKGEL